MTEMTRSATQTDLDDLLERVPHANLAFETERGIAAVPVGFSHVDGRYWVGLPRADGDKADDPRAGHQAMLLIDDGTYYFELLGLRVRGALLDSPAPPGLDSELRWLELEPSKINAWDYGSMRARGKP